MKNKSTNPHPAAPKKNVRARLMYTVDGTNYVTFDKSERVWPGFMPAYVLPATAEAFDAMVSQGVDVALEAWYGSKTSGMEDVVKAILKSYKITKPKS